MKKPKQKRRKISLSLLLLLSGIWTVATGAILVFTNSSQILIDELAAPRYSDGSLILASLVFYLPIIIGSVGIAIPLSFLKFKDKKTILISSVVGAMLLSFVIGFIVRIAHFVVNY